MFQKKWFRNISVILTVALILTAVGSVSLPDLESPHYLTTSTNAAPYDEENEQKPGSGTGDVLIDHKEVFSSWDVFKPSEKEDVYEGSDSADGKAKVIIVFKAQPAKGFMQQMQRIQQTGIVQSAGGDVDKAFTIVNALSARLPQKAIVALSKRHDVSYIEPDFTLKAISQTVPWGVNRVFGSSGYSFSTWNNSRGQGISVAVLDTGIDMNHIDLPSLSGGQNTIDGTHWGSDVYGHGTHVAGTIAALDNDMGVVGIAPGIALYSVKVLDDQGSGTTSSVIAGVEWARNNNIKIVNMSLGGPNYSQALKDACDAAYAGGMLLVASAGNDGPSIDNVLYPARYSSVIAVSASDSNNNIASFSSRGPSVELIAPGVYILSLFPVTAQADFLSP